MRIVERNKERLVVRHEPWSVWLSTTFAMLVGALIVAYGVLQRQYVVLAVGVVFVVAVPLVTAHVARLVTATFDRAAGLITVERRGPFGSMTRSVPMDQVIGVECSPFTVRQPRSIRERRPPLGAEGAYVVRLRLSDEKTLSLASMRSCERGHHSQLAVAIRAFLGIETEQHVA